MIHDESKKYEPVLEHAQRITKQDKPYGEKKAPPTQQGSQSPANKKE